MKTQFALVLVFASLGTLPAPARSQNPASSPTPETRGAHQMGPMHGPMLHDLLRNSEVAAKLQLSDAQRSQLEKIFADHRNSFVSTREQLRSAEDAVRQALDADPVNETAYNANVANAQALRAKVTQDFAAMTLAFRKVLTLEQWKALEALQQKQMQDFKLHHEKEKGWKEQDQAQPGK